MLQCKVWLLALTTLIANYPNFAQPDTSAHKKSQGTISPLREFDVHHYDLNVEVDIDNQSIRGFNEISFTVSKPTSSIQVDLFDEFKVTSVTMNEKKLDTKKGTKHFVVEFSPSLQKDRTYTIRVEYAGIPQVAKNAPWDGGFVWSKDSLGNPWIATSCQGLGASSWWPNKDHLSDRPDSMDMRISLPDKYSKLYAVSNGELKSINEHDKHIVFHWHTSYPINNYNVTLNIGNYAHFDRKNYSKSSHKALKLDFYVLRQNKNKAKTHFIQLYDMLNCYEDYFGPYPFWNDGFGIVETPFWGMEHQGAIAYGNNYVNNTYGFDFILIHESAHEYWGNSVSCTDMGELWIHEAFATYTESLFVEWKNGKERAYEYLQSQRPKIKNIEPLIGPLGENYNDYKSTDMYYKGAWMLHTVRQIVNNDSVWFNFIRSLAIEYKSRHISTDQLLIRVEKELGTQVIPFMKHIIYQSSIPKIEFEIKKGKKMKFRMIDVKDGFQCHIPIKCESETIEVTATSQWQELKKSDQKIIGPVLENYLIEPVTTK